MSPPEPKKGSEPAPPPGLKERVAQLPALVRARLAGVRKRLPKRFTKRHAQALVGIGLLLVLVQVLATRMMEEEVVEVNPADELNLKNILTALDAGHTDEARHKAAQLRARGSLPYRDQGGPAYVFGMIASAEAEAATDPRAQLRSYLIAARYLEESQALGFPPGREGEAQFKLGRALFNGRKYVRAQHELHEALPLAPEHRAETLLLLTRAHVREVKPNLRVAADYVADFLKTPKLSPEMKRAGLLEQCEIALRAGDREQVDATLAQFQGGVANDLEVMVLRARALLALRSPPAATEAAANEALEVARKIQAVAPSASDAARSASCLIGLAYVQLGEQAAAKTQLERVRRVYYDTPEALVAAVELADLTRHEGKFDDALVLYKACVQEAGQPRKFSHPWITFEQLGNRLLQSVTELREAKEFAAALALVETLPPVLAEDVALQLSCDIHQAWAERLMLEAQNLPEEKARPKEAEARSQWRHAGSKFADLAKLRFATREYTDLLWSSGDCFLRGKDFGRAMQIFQRYLKEEPRRRRPTTLVSLGEALIGLGREGEARPPFRECIEFYPQDPSAFRARLFEAQIYVMRGELAEAKKLMQENLGSDAISPASLEWRDSLFALGRLLHEEGTAFETESRAKGIDSRDPDLIRAGLKVLEQSHAAHQEAIRRLQEAVDRYPQYEKTIEASYLLAESQRAAARLPQKKLPTVTIETIRVNLNREKQASLTASVATYEALERTLSERQEAHELSEQEKNILRNSYFGHADALFDLGKYEDAIRAYANATNRYQRDPEVLEAYMQIAACYRRLNKPVEARGTLEQAKVVLSRLRPETEFRNTSRYNRDDWTQFLDWMSRL